MEKPKMNNLTEDTIKRIITLPYELVAKRRCKEAGYEITINSVVEKKTAV